MAPVLGGLLITPGASLVYQFQKFNPFVPRQFVYPSNLLGDYAKRTLGTNRFWAYGTGRIDANLSTTLGLYSPDGYNPLYPKWYGAFVQTAKNGTIPTDFTTQTRSDA